MFLMMDQKKEMKIFVISRGEKPVRVTGICRTVTAPEEADVKVLVVKFIGWSLVLDE